MIGGAVEQVCFNNCTPSWWGIIYVHYAVFYHSPVRSCYGDAAELYERENSYGKVKIEFFKSLLLAETPETAFRWDFKLVVFSGDPPLGAQVWDLGLCSSPTAAVSQHQSRTPASGGPINPTTDPWHHTFSIASPLDQTGWNKRVLVCS